MFNKKSFVGMFLYAVLLVAIFSYDLGQLKVLNEAKSKRQVLGFEFQKEAEEIPLKLVIPALNISADIRYLGVNSSGEMDIPKSVMDVGWFGLGPIPGVLGSSVIAGHLNGTDGKSGVFGNLNKLKIGDKLYVENNKGNKITFMVREKKFYNSGYADEIFNRNDKSYLNLVTCNGVWDDDKKSYSMRLVVFTEKI